MAKATQAILHHYSSIETNLKHKFCPTGSDSWCSYQRDLANGTNLHKPIKNPFPPATVSVIKPLANLRSTTRPAQRRACERKKLSCQTKTVNNSWSQGYSQRLCHSQHNVKLSIITSFMQRESLLRPKGCYLKSKLQQTLHRFSRT